MKRTLLLPILASHLLVSCYGPTYPQRYYPQGGYQSYGHQQSYGPSAEYGGYSTAGSRSTTESDSWVAPLVLLGGAVLVASMFSDDSPSTSSSSGTSTWSDGMESASRREENRFSYDRDPSAPLPFPGEGY